MILEKYDSYKDSGVEWLGDIPKDWEVKRVKNIGKLQNGISQSAEYFGEGFPFVSYSDVYNQRIVLEEIEGLAKSSKEEQKLYSVKENDIFFTRTSETIEEIAFSSVCNETIPNAVFSGFVIRLRPFLYKINKGFSKYYFNARANRHFFVKEMNIVTRASLSQGLLYQLPVLLPDLQEQHQIVNFLDKKTAQIDSKIDLLQKKIVNYKELKRSLINETVCRGLNKNVTLKDSEVEWIGKIPEHWTVERLKKIFNERSEKNKKIDGQPITDNILSVIKDVGVINHRDKGNVGNKMSEDISEYKIVYPKDIVVNKMNVIIGSVGISKEFGALSVIYIILKTKSSHYPEFYDYVFKSKYFQKYLRTIATGILEIREAVNSHLFRQQKLPTPPKEEQIQIANYLDEKTTKIDAIISKITDQINTLKEFRKTLINDVVTGKIKVSE